jgi:6-phosphofructokinase 1
MEGGEIVERGKADAFGHQKLGGIGQVAGEMIKEITGVGIIHQNVAYLMRCGAPDALDLMVATNYGTLAADLLLAKQSGRMVALKNGCYTHVSLTETRAGARKIDVDALYDSENYRPRMRSVEGLPMFLR